MKIDSLNDLKKVIELCQKQGVTTIKVDGIELTFGIKPTKSKTYKTEVFTEADIKVPQFNGIANPNVSQYVSDTIETDGMTDEQLLMWSAQSEAN